MRSPYQKTMYACFIGYIVQAVVNNFVPLLFVTFQKTYQISLSKITFLITIKAIPHKERLATLHAICLQISRHISQKCSRIHQVFTPLFVSSDEKFDDASVAQSLCGIARNKIDLTFQKEAFLWEVSLSELLL